MKANQGTVISLFIVGMLAFIFYIVIGAFWGGAQTTYSGLSANMTATDAGTTTSRTFFGIGLWVIVAGCFIALFLIVLRTIRTRR